MLRDCIELVTSRQFQHVVNDLQRFYKVRDEKDLDEHNARANHIKRVAQIKKCSLEMKKLKSINEAMTQSVGAMIQLQDIFMQMKYEMFSNKTNNYDGPNFLQRMEDDGERRQLEGILSQFTDTGVPLHELSLDSISSKIMQLVKIAIGQKFKEMMAKRNKAAE